MNGLRELPPKIRENLLRTRGEFLDRIDFLLSKGNQQAHAIDKALLTLSSGALLLSVTFVGTLAETKHCILLLFGSWLFFIVSVLCVLFGMWKAQYLAHAEASRAADTLEEICKKHWVNEAVNQHLEFDPRMVVKMSTHKGIYTFNLLAVGSFILGIVCLCAFVGLNLNAKPNHPTHVLALLF